MRFSAPNPLDPQAPGVVASVLRYWRSSLLIVVGFAAAAYAISGILPEQYKATSLIKLTDPYRDNVFSTGGALPEDLERYTEAEATVMRSRRVLQEVRKEVGASSVRDIRSRITVDSELVGQLSVTATAGTADGAAELANETIAAYRKVTSGTTNRVLTSQLEAIQQSYLELDSEIQGLAEEVQRNPSDPILQADLRASLNELASLNGTANEIRVNAAAFNDGIRFYDPANAPSSPTEPQPLRNAGVAALLGLLVAGALSWIRADRHRAADTSDTPAVVLNTPLLGSVPELDPGAELSALRDADSPLAESYQFVTASLAYVFRFGVLLVTSAERGDGKTISAASIAAAAARDGTRVALVDADARAFGLTRRLLGESTPRVQGLTDLADNGAGQADVGRLLALSEEVTLPFVPAGSHQADVGSLFRTKGMANAVQGLREAYDLVVVDCPSLLSVADVASLAVQADGIIVVVSRGTPIDTLEAVRQRLDLVPAPLIGYVFTHDRGGAKPYLAAPPMPSHLGRSAGGRPFRRRQPKSPAPPTNGGRRHKPIDLTTEGNGRAGHTEPSHEVKDTP